MTTNCFFPKLDPNGPEAWERFPTFAWSAECWFPGWEVAWFEGSGGLCHGKIYWLMVSFFSTMLRLWYITTPQRLTMYLLGMFWSHQPVELSWRKSHTSRKHLVDLSWTEIHILKMLVYFTKVWEVVYDTGSPSPKKGPAPGLHGWANGTGGRGASCSTPHWWKTSSVRGNIPQWTWCVPPDTWDQVRTQHLWHPI